jgi:hypothetical protein
MSDTPKINQQDHQQQQNQVTESPIKKAKFTQENTLKDTNKDAYNSKTSTTV